MWPTSLIITCEAAHWLFACLVGYSVFCLISTIYGAIHHQELSTRQFCHLLLLCALLAFGSHIALDLWTEI